MSKKTLELAIDLLNQINTFDLSAYTPIRFDNKNIGWLNNKIISKTLYYK